MGIELQDTLKNHKDDVIARRDNNCAIAWQQGQGERSFSYHVPAHIYGFSGSEKTSSFFPPP
jgi:hypothetical protein